MLDDLPPPAMKYVDFEEWWDKDVFVDNKGRRLSRGQLVLTVADQDGGAHVDPEIDGIYADLSRNNSLAWEAINGQEKRPMEGPERAAIRQIAHEMLKTLKPRYSKKPQHAAGMILGGGISS